MKIKLIFFLLTIMASCTPILNKNKLSNIDCRTFEVTISDKEIADKIFSSIFSLKLSEKLDLVSNKNSKNICKININFNENTVSSIVNDTGSNDRYNYTLNVLYKIYLDENKIKTMEGSISIFYGTNELWNRYSNELKIRKEKENNIINIVNKLFIEIIGKMNRL